MSPKDAKQLSNIDSSSQAEPQDSLYQLIYVSVAKNKFSQADLEAILNTSRKHNTAQHITGLLLYSNGNVVQVLEGPKKAVQDLFGRIQVDPRHHHIKMLSFQKVAKRDFKNWSMGFKRVDESIFQKEIPNFTDIVEQRAVNMEALAGFSIKVGFILKNFALSNRLDDLKQVN